jgi:signal peptide peptidase SppA
MHYAHIWRALGATPWAILPSKLSAIVELVARRERGEDLDPEEIRALVGAARQQQQPRAGSGIAVLPIMGTLVQRASMLEQASGATSCEQIGALFAQALADPGIGTILLNIDSPGGNVNGIPELAAQIADGAKQKRVVAVANSLAASAAYWLASQAESLYVTPSGMVGSIGVIAAHEDISGLLDRAGVTMSLITAGKFKGEMNPFMPLSDEDRAATQQQVDYYYGLFTRAVAHGRGTTAGAVQAGMGQGRVVNAPDAVRLGMADGIKTVDQVLAALANGRLARPDRPAAVAADWGSPEIAGPTHEPTATGDAARSTGIVAAGASAVGFPTDEPAAAQESGPPHADADLRRRRLRLHEALAR